MAMHGEKTSTVDVEAIGLGSTSVRQANPGNQWE
jgi:hypothetical protein